MAAYEYKKGYIGRVDVNVAREVLDSLADRNGHVEPRAVLDASRDANAPLHDVFDWDDSVAAENWRLYQARQLIINIVTVETNDQEEREQTRTFVSAPQKNAYVTLQAALNDDEMRVHLLEQARRDAKIFLSKYRNLQELAKVTETMNEFLQM